MKRALLHLIESLEKMPDLRDRSFYRRRSMIDIIKSVNKTILLYKLKSLWEIVLLLSRYYFFRRNSPLTIDGRSWSELFVRQIRTALRSRAQQKIPFY